MDAEGDPVALIERAAFAAWPAAETVGCRGAWVFRATSGVTRRANSVWLGGAMTGDLAEAITDAERFYEARGLSPVFQVSPVFDHAAIDAALAARGYAKDGEVDVQAARAAEVARLTASPRTGLSVSVAPALTDPWFTLSAQGRYAGVESLYEALLKRLGTRARFGLACCDGQPCAVGLLVLDDASGWAGLFSMHTLPSFRRRGASRALLGALALEATRAGKDDLYLQVERENAPAHALYAAAGFVTHHAYHYRSKPAPCGAHAKGC